MAFLANWPIRFGLIEIFKFYPIFQHNALYNHMPSIVARISTDPALGEAQVEEILEFLLLRIDKDQQREKLMDKLGERFPDLEKRFTRLATLRPKKEEGGGGAGEATPAMTGRRQGRKK